jgi:putative SOS response-associated peptidase YedK
MMLHKPTAAQWPAWLGEAAASEAELLALLAPSDPRLITAWQIGKRVGSVRNDDAGLVAPLAEPAPRLV